ncbi:MAG: hypothetical protein FJ299_16640, partial [Planctomycetes bacterium]|nr:hypothetical protein [Planctomycetota bacterium]
MAAPASDRSGPTPSAARITRPADARVGRDTIAALASPAGPARRGVIRVSGPRAAPIVAACVRVADGAR